MSSVAMFFIGFASGIVAFIGASVVIALIAKKRQEKKLADACDTWAKQFTDPIQDFMEMKRGIPDSLKEEGANE